MRRASEAQQRATQRPSRRRLSVVQAAVALVVECCVRLGIGCPDMCQPISAWRGTGAAGGGGGEASEESSSSSPPPPPPPAAPVAATIGVMMMSNRTTHAPEQRARESRG